MNPFWLWGISISKSKREEEEGEAGEDKKESLGIYKQEGKSKLGFWVGGGGELIY